MVLTLAFVALAVVLGVVLAAQPGTPPGAQPATHPATQSSTSADTRPGTQAGSPPSSASPTATTPSLMTGSATPTTPPAAEPFPPSLRGQDLAVIPGAGRVVALTFDAGANAAGLPKILSTLSAKGVRGTFFLTGNWAAANPAGVSQIAAAGHPIGNHSMTHPGFTGLSDDRIAQEVLAAEQAIRAAGGDPRPLFRFPYGERDARTIAAVNGLGYVAVRWTVDTLGWKGTSGGISTQTVTDRVLASLQPGEIVLMHIGSNPDDDSTLDADALSQMIDRISAAGYGFVTLGELHVG
ncbi:polysaccharide deacetylase family protein [Arthrobacter sp. ISL-30]|nr:polysaccharide deacetylase family protein [Arthrobacter sp. ISL-30]